jgi:hypothetical protein
MAAERYGSGEGSNKYISVEISAAFLRNTKDLNNIFTKFKDKEINLP